MATRYQRGNQKLEIDEAHTMPWPQDTQGGNQKLEIDEAHTISWPQDTKEVIRSRKSRKQRQYNGQKTKDKSTNKDLQNTTQKTD